MQMSSVERNERGELFGRSECSSTTALCYSGIGDGWFRLEVNKYIREGDETLMMSASV